ncbi:MAG: flagellar biosynthetic protein FliO [Rhizobiaceae bacterium]
MAAWFEGMFGADYAPLAMWAAIALVAVLAFLVIHRIVRRAMSGTFVAGGKGRRPRLAVLDAAAVDSHRRLVLVRRDDTEHLILIGGPTDVVVEQGIRRAPAAPADNRASVEPAATPQPREPDVPSDPPLTARAERQPEPPPQPAVRQTRSEPAATAARPSEESRAGVGAAAGEISAGAAASATDSAARNPAVAARLAAGYGASETVDDTPAPAAETRQQAAAEPVQERADLNAALLKELEVTLDRSAPAMQRTPGARPPEVDGGMAELVADTGRRRS